MKKRKLVAILAVMLALMMLCTTALAGGRNHGNQERSEQHTDKQSKGGKTTPAETKKEDPKAHKPGEENPDPDKPEKEDPDPDKPKHEGAPNSEKHGHGSNNGKGDKHHNSHNHDNCKPDNEPSCENYYFGTWIVQIAPPAQCIPILPPRTGGASLGLLYGIISMLGLAGVIGIKARKR